MLKLAASLEHKIKYENDEIHIDVTVKILVLDMRFQRGSTAFYDLTCRHRDVVDNRFFPIGGDIIDEIGGFGEGRNDF